MTGNSCCSTTQTASPLLNWRFATTGANAAGEPVRGRWFGSRVWPEAATIETATGARGARSFFMA
jgi:hypothetical protein